MRERALLNRYFGEDFNDFAAYVRATGKDAHSLVRRRLRAITALRIKNARQDAFSRRAFPWFRVLFTARHAAG